jgi:hypothetical protein
MSAAARKRIAEGQKKRWEAYRKASARPPAKTEKAAEPTRPPKRRISAAGRKRIAEATRKRWAEFRLKAKRSEKAQKPAVARKAARKKAAKSPAKVATKALKKANAQRPKATVAAPEQATSAVVAGE